MSSSSRLAELRGRVHPPAGAVDPEVVRAAVEQALAERERAAAAVEREREEAQAVGGPCRYCGVTRSREYSRESNRPVGRWYPGSVCALCRADKEWGVAGRPDVEHREFVLRRLLPVEVTRDYAPGGSLVKATGFRWWWETPGAVVSEVQPFAYVDLDGLVGCLADQPAQHATRQPCPRCGVTNLWQPAADTHGAQSWVCAGCRAFGQWADLASAATGLTVAAVESLGAAGPQVLAVRWWVDDPAGGRAAPPHPCPVPFAYLDRAVARRAGYLVFGGEDFAERRWRGPGAYAAARQAANQ